MNSLLLQSRKTYRKALFAVLITINFALFLPKHVIGESVCCEKNYDIENTVSCDYCRSQLVLIHCFTTEAALSHQQQCGVNPRMIGRLFRSIGKFLGKGGKRLKPKSKPKPNEGFFKRIAKWFKEIKWPWKKVIIPSELLLQDIEKVRVSNEIIPKIEKYISETKPNEEGLKLLREIKSDATKAEEYLANSNSNNEEGVKVIRCLKSDSEKVKLTLKEGNSTKINKTITNLSETFNVSHYDINAMRERFCFVEGIEYVEFIIPKKAQYILNGQYGQRVYECLIFNLPKDSNGNWEKVKALIIDIFNHPYELWSEVRFRQELKKLNVDSRTVNEIEQYMFVHNNLNNKNRKEMIYDQFTYEEVA